MNSKDALINYLMQNGINMTKCDSKTDKGDLFLFCSIILKILTFVLHFIMAML